MVTDAKLREYKRRYEGHTTVLGLAVVVLTARELQELLEYIETLKTQVGIKT